jgi:hypothetical protein
MYMSDPLSATIRPVGDRKHLAPRERLEQHLRGGGFEGRKGDKCTDNHKSDAHGRRESLHAPCRIRWKKAEVGDGKNGPARETVISRAGV